MRHHVEHRLAPPGVPIAADDILRVRVATEELKTDVRRLDVEDLPSRIGANLELWAGADAVGATGTGEIRIAPAARVRLDLVGREGRYSDGADLLEERILAWSKQQASRCPHRWDDRGDHRRARGRGRATRQAVGAVEEFLAAHPAAP